METVGGYLKKEREAKNISLREVARKTRISEFYLDYIEKDDYAKLPQGPYIKGYISSYSRLIGGNVEQALELYDALNRERKQAAEVQPEAIEPPKGWRTAIGASLNSIASSLNRNKTNGRRLSPDDPERTTTEAATASLQSKSRTVAHAVASYIITKSRSLVAAVSSPPTRITSVFRSFVAIATATCRLTRPQTWLYGGIAIVGASILVLAGVGMYHLVYFETSPARINDTQPVRDDEPVPVVDASGNASPASKMSPVGKSSPLSPPMSSQHPSPVDDRSERASTVHASPSMSQRVSDQAEVDTIRPVLAEENPQAATQSSATSTADDHLSVLKASICSQIKNRMPSGVGRSFPASVERVYVWSQIEANHVPSKVRHIYYFKGREISDVSLGVRSANWRTWSYKSMASQRYRGQWRVDITTADGKVLRRLYFEIN